MKQIITFIIVYTILQICILISNYNAVKRYKNKLKTKLKDKTDEQILDRIYNELEL